LPKTGQSASEKQRSTIDGGAKAVFDPEFEAHLRQRAKAELRRHMRGVRAAVPPAACAARSERIVTRVLELPEFARARALGLFWPMLDRNEVDVRPLDEAARARGLVVAYPRQTEDGLVLVVTEPSSLAECGHGFCEPPADAPALAIDDTLLVVVPALAVDPKGNRIGYGRGLYDCLLDAIAPPAFAVAVVYDFQVVSEVPVTAGDRAVDVIVTDLRCFRPQT
jgi:5-formyltetrahydrofolate cyclo-ligase